MQVSNVTGENLELLKMFLNLLSNRTPNTDDAPPEFQIDDTYSVPGVGTVVSGTNLRGTIRLNDTLLLGPDPLGHFASIAVKSIHRKRMPVAEVGFHDGSSSFTSRFDFFLANVMHLGVYWKTSHFSRFCGQFGQLLLHIFVTSIVGPLRPDCLLRPEEDQAVPDP